MLELGWSEIFVIAVLIILVVGPKELPGVMRSIGHIFRRLQYMKFALSQQFEEFMRDADLDDLRKSVNFEVLKHEAEGKKTDFNEAEADEEYLAEEIKPEEEEKRNDQ